MTTKSNADWLEAAQRVLTRNAYEKCLSGNVEFLSDADAAAVDHETQYVVRDRLEALK